MATLKKREFIVQVIHGSYTPSRQTFSIVKTLGQLVKTPYTIDIEQDWVGGDHQAFIACVEQGLLNAYRYGVQGSLHIMIDSKMVTHITSINLPHVKACDSRVNYFTYGISTQGSGVGLNDVLCITGCFGTAPMLVSRAGVAGTIQTTLSFKLNLCPCEKPPSDNTAVSRVPKSMAVADDMEFIQDVVTAVMEDAGVHNFIVCGSTECNADEVMGNLLQNVGETAEKVECMLLDNNIGEIASGVEIAARLMDKYHGYVALHTGCSNAEKEDLTGAMGVDDVFQKPLDAGEFVSCYTKYLEAHTTPCALKAIDACIDLIETKSHMQKFSHTLRGSAAVLKCDALAVFLEAPYIDVASMKKVLLKMRFIKNVKAGNWTTTHAHTDL